MSRLSAHETWQGFFVRKKVKSVSALATIAGDIIWKPAPGRQFLVTDVFIKKRTVTGTVSDEPNIKLTNSASDIVAAVDLNSALAIQKLTVAGTFLVTYDTPLTLVSADAQNGGTVYDYDIIIFAKKISE